MENKLDYIIEKIKNIQKIQILELGVQNGSSTKKFIELCALNDGFLTSIDIDDCSKVIKSDRWKFIHSSDDDFEKIDKIISKSLDFIFIDSLHETNHVEKVFYHYYSFLKKGGMCIIDDISWLPYSKNESIVFMRFVMMNVVRSSATTDWVSSKRQSVIGRPPHIVTRMFVNKANYPHGSKNIQR